jgi:hypothetical protein
MVLYGVRAFAVAGQHRFKVVLGSVSSVATKKNLSQTAPHKEQKPPPSPPSPLTEKEREREREVPLSLSLCSGCCCRCCCWLLSLERSAK